MSTWLTRVEVNSHMLCSRLPLHAHLVSHWQGKDLNAHAGKSSDIPTTCVPVQFEAFARGFQELLGGPAINLFSGTELERLVCGNPLLDFAALQKHSRYDGGYTPEHRVMLKPSEA